ncbi:hypothetical protein ACFL6I_09170 [candidate division KSB1 bacterium]
MNKKITLLSLVIALMILTACSQQFNIVAHEEIKFYDSEDVRGCGRYMDSSVLSVGTVVINSQEDYQALLDQYQVLHKCEWGKEPPAIDFSQKTLLGQFTTGGGCSIEYNRIVKRFDEEKKIVYTVEVKEKGFCDMAGISMNWITIPKIPAGYGVEFKIKK